MRIERYMLTFNGDWADLIPSRDVFDHDKGPDCMCGPEKHISHDDVVIWKHARLAVEEPNA